MAETASSSKHSHTISSLVPVFIICTTCTRTGAQRSGARLPPPCRILRETNRLLKEGDYLKGDPGKQTAARRKEGESAWKKNNFSMPKNVSAIKWTRTHTDTHVHNVSFNLIRTSTQTDSPQTPRCGEQPEACAEISGDATARKTRSRATEDTFKLFYVCFNNAADVLNS